MAPVDQGKLRTAQQSADPAFYWQFDYSAAFRPSDVSYRFVQEECLLHACSSRQCGILLPKTMMGPAYTFDLKVCLFGRIIRIADITEKG